MKKINIVGIVAAGKTTLARKLSKMLDIHYYELDCIVHHKTSKERYKRTPEQQREVIDSINQQDCWIIEGTYRPSCHDLLDLADTIIFLDPPLWKRKWRIIKRFIRQQLKIEKCHYQSTFAMLRKMFEWTYNFEQDRTRFENLLHPYSKKLIRLNDNKDRNLQLFNLAIE